MDLNIFMMIGFVAGAYSIIANDSIQTLGTFIASNSKRRWWVLWLYSSSILTAVLLWGWLQGDVAYGRLSKIPMPENFTFWYCLPPFALILLTRFGYPVSTTFLILSAFSQKAIPNMLVKSLMGYGLALVVGLAVYSFIAKRLEKKFHSSPIDPKNQSKWMVFQWLTTGFLWTQWLIQDLANIFVFLPRELTTLTIGAALITIIALQAYTFYYKGGEIQKIVNRKSGSTDIRSATIIDLCFACLLLFFKELNNIPMSTTWVFLGLLAGRELGLCATKISKREMKNVWSLVFSDLGKATIGIIVSVVIALSIPLLAG